MSGVYYPGVSRKALQNMIDKAEWIDTSIHIQGFKLHFQKTVAGTRKNALRIAQSLANNGQQTLVFSISNPVYSKDGNSCLLFVIVYQHGAYTVEISKDLSGNWVYKTVLGDWLE